MANLKIDTTIRNNMMDEITAVAGSSVKIKIYSSSQPAGGAATSATLLGTLTGASTFAAAATGGVLTLNAITGDSSADATGTAAWFRLTQSDDTWVLDGDVTVTGGGGDLTLDSIAIVIGGTINLSGTNTLTASNAA